MLDFLANILQNKIILYPFVFGLTSAILALIISPLQFLKIQRQAGYSSYLSIIKYRYKNHGLGIFFIGAVPYSLLQFFSSAAFGTSEFFSKNIIAKYGLAFNPVSILIGTILAGFFETILTLYFEIKMLEKNKINLLDIEGTIGSILPSLFLRNSLSWVGSLGSIFILKFIENKYQIQLSYSISFLIAFFCGAIWALLTIPIDVVISQNFGSFENLKIIDRLKKNILEGGYREIFKGSLMRVIMLTLFTICTVLTENFLRR